MTKSIKQSGHEHDRVYIFDTTLVTASSHRASMSLEEKLQIAELLDAMGAMLSAGFDCLKWRFCAYGSRQAKCASMWFGPAGAKDIDRAADAVKHAKNPRIHTFISTVRHKHKLQMEPDEVMEAIAFCQPRAQSCRKR